MAKGAATENTLGKLHDKLALVFSKVLEKHIATMDAISDVDASSVEDEVLMELLDKGWEPNPAMLSAISKFLKDNEIMYDTEQLEELSSLERRLADKRKNREKVVSLNNLRTADGS